MLNLKPYNPTSQSGGLTLKPYNPNVISPENTQAAQRQGFGGFISRALIDPLKGGVQNVKKIASGVGKSVKEAYTGSVDALSDAMVGRQSGVSAGFQTAGNAAKALLSPITETLNVGINDVADKASDIKSVQNFSNSKIATVLTEKAAVPGEAYAKWAEQHPEASKNLEALGNITALATSVPAGAKVLPKVKNTLKTGLDKAKTGLTELETKAKISLSDKASKVKTSMIEKQAASIDEKLGLQKNTKGAVNQRKVNELTGQKTPGEVLVENNIPFDNNAPQILQDHAMARQVTKQALLKTEGKWGVLDDWAAQAKENLNLSGEALEKGKAIIDKELAAYKKQFTTKGQVVDGKLKIPLEEADKIKSGLGKQAYGKGLTTTDQITKTAQGQFSKTIKKGIEELSENEFIKALNREEGNFLNAIGILEGKDLSLLKTKPGVLNKVISRGAGALTGSVGGTGGAVAGYEAGGYLANILAKAPEKLRQMIINNLKETAEGKELLLKAQELLKQRQSEQIIRPQLETSKVIYAPDKYQNVPNKGSVGKVTEAERTVFRNPKSGKMQRGYKSSSKP